MTFINDPGEHWHKDDMLDEPDIPGVTSPQWNYDEHADYINECSRYESGNDISKEDYMDMYRYEDDCPF